MRMKTIITILTALLVGCGSAWATTTPRGANDIDGTGAFSMSGNVDLNAELDCSDTAVFGMGISVGVVVITASSDAVDTEDVKMEDDEGTGNGGVTLIYDGTDAIWRMIGGAL